MKRLNSFIQHLEIFKIILRSGHMKLKHPRRLIGVYSREGKYYRKAVQNSSDIVRIYNKVSHFLEDGQLQFTAYAKL